MKRFFVLLIITAGMVGCETDVDFKLKDAPNVLAVDASIETGLTPVVVLTKSFSFYGNITPQILTSNFVHNAVITISNGTLTHQLKEYIIPTAFGVDLYVYKVDSSNLSTVFSGEFGKAYSLKILSEGQEYTANTTIPLLHKKIDSMWWKTAPYQDDTTKILLMVKSTDPPGLGNYVRYFTKKNSEPFLPGANSTFDDQVIDGSTYQVQVQPGINRNAPGESDSNYFRRGDTITMKLCNIDKSTFTFWSTWEYAAQSIGNPFAQPGKVLGNISNGALGEFYGYAPFYKTLIVPK